MVDRFSHKLADNYMLAMSGLFTAPAAATYDIISIPKWAFVYDLFFEMVTLDSSGGTITVGFKGNAETPAYDVDYFFTNTETAPATAGMKNPVSTGFAKYFSGAAGTMTVTVASTAFTVAQFRVFAGYMVIR